MKKLIISFILLLSAISSYAQAGVKYYDKKNSETVKAEASADL